jgi:hypothetical protein
LVGARVVCRAGSDEETERAEYVVGSVSGGGTSTLTIVALVLGALGLLVGGIALFSRGGRTLT